MTKPHLAEVVSIYETNASDMAAMLRQCATSVESETEEDDRTECMVGIQFSECGRVKLYGWGDIDSYKTLAILQLALADHTERMLVRE